MTSKQIEMIHVIFREEAKKEEIPEKKNMNRIIVRFSLGKWLCSLLFALYVLAIWTVVLFYNRSRKIKQYRASIDLRNIYIRLKTSITANYALRRLM